MCKPTSNEWLLTYARNQDNRARAHVRVNTKQVGTVGTKQKTPLQALSCKGLSCSHHVCFLVGTRWEQVGTKIRSRRTVPTGFSAVPTATYVRWEQTNPVTARVTGACSHRSHCSHRFFEYTRVCASARIPPEKNQRNHFFSCAGIDDRTSAQATIPLWLADMPVQESQRDNQGETTP